MTDHPRTSRGAWSLSAVEMPLRVGSLCSGYEGPNLAVENHFDAEITWYSDLNAHVARVYSHRLPMPGCRG